MYPQNQAELLRFIGLMNYYRRFIPKFADKMEPLLAIAEFSWSPLCQRVFDSLKAEISQQPILKPFSLDLDSTLTVDASEHAAAGVLSLKAVIQ